MVDVTEKGRGCFLIQKNAMVDVARKGRAFLKGREKGRRERRMRRDGSL
jgi:hypothetical protein